MWLTKLLDVISRYFPSDPLAGIETAVAKLNPDKIYVENVRSILKVPHTVAVAICETAVRQGVFDKGIEVLGPDGAVAVAAHTEDELPKTIQCWVQDEGRFEEIVLKTDELKKITFYRLNDSAATAHA